MPTRIAVLVRRVSLRWVDDSEDRQPDVKGSSLYNEAGSGY